MATTLVDGITLSYVDEGSGDPVVLLHGWAGQAASMTPLIVELRDRYRVITFDLPGFGGSGPPPVPWGTPEYAAFVERAVASLGLSLIHISEPTRLGMISYAVFCLKKKKKK